MMGWAAHFMVGIFLAVIYAVVASRLPGPVVLYGAVVGLVYGASGQMSGTVTVQ